MQRHSNTHISFLIVFLSILTIMVQFTAYFFFASEYLVLGISCLISIISISILLEQSLSYEPCFIYTFLTLFVSLIIAILTYYSKGQSFIPYTNTLLIIVAINWLIPTLNGMVRCMLDFGPRFEGFHSFYRNNSIIFMLFYISFLIYSSFVFGAFPWANATTLIAANFTPFMNLATLIERYINYQASLISIVLYLISRIIIYLPYGYYCTLILRRKSRLQRILSLLILPIIIEILQFFYYNQRSDIDDIIYGFLGGILGALLFHLINLIFRTISGKNFLAKESDYRYSNSSLHF